MATLWRTRCGAENLSGSRGHSSLALGGGEGGGGGETEKEAPKYKEPPRSVPQENGTHHHPIITVPKHHS